MFFETRCKNSFVELALSRLTDREGIRKTCTIALKTKVPLKRISRNASSKISGIDCL